MNAKGRGRGKCCSNICNLEKQKKMLRVSTKQHQKGKLRLNAASSLLYDHFIFA